METKEYTLKINDFTALDIAVSSDEGDKINEKIEYYLGKVEILTLDFGGIQLMTTAFLNASIGQLYRNHTSEFLNKHLKIINMDPSDFSLLRKVIETAKEYYKDPETFNAITKEVLGDE